MPENVKITEELVKSNAFTENGANVRLLEFEEVLPCGLKILRSLKITTQGSRSVTLDINDYDPESGNCLSTGNSWTSLNKVNDSENL